MNDKRINSIIYLATLILSLSLVIIMLERTVHVFGINIFLLVINVIGSIVAFLIIWFLRTKAQGIKNWLYLLGNATCIISIILWIVWKEMIILYLLGIAFIILHLIYESPVNGDEVKRAVNKNLLLIIESIIFMGLSLSYLLAVFLWRNEILYVVSGSLGVLLAIFLYTGKLKAKEPSSQDKTNAESKILLKNLMRDILLGIIPFLLAGLLFLLFYGYLIFIPLDFSTGKLIIAAILAALSLFFSFLAKREVKNKE
ncbi:MAG: hypothetical protein EU544_03535 [Promethearchaeota archaeon]|nr:MAG: hypothetical protein EU544_03535 [Candidatus Lokiarchaeota archaeon]